GLYRSLAEVCQEIAALEDDENRRFGYLLKAGNAFLDSGEDLELAIEPLAEAHALRPNDLDAVALLSDANTSVGRIDAAADILNATLATMKNRRSREIGTLYHRVARVAQARGDRQGEMAALTTALEMDPQNGVAALELSQIAIELGDLDLAARALRALTMLRGEGPIPRALAYKQLGEIAWAQGDQKKAVIMLKRALDDDPRLEEARTLLAQIEGR
ncbi:tetratricopeptide repeat protein, partial [bacterium]